VRCIALPAFQAQIALQRVAKPLFVVSGNHEPDLSANAFLTYFEGDFFIVEKAGTEDR
jgi:hypothetical protein